MRPTINFAVLHEANCIIEALLQMHSIRGVLTFAVVASRSPFQVTRVKEDEFIVLVDQRAFYYLLTLCLRLQSLPELAKPLAETEIVETRDYAGKYLLDITKDIVFHTADISHLNIATQGRAVFQAALAYIIAHEVAHVSHGHLEFKLSPHFPEFSRDDGDKNLTLRTLEMDADSTATTSVFAMFERAFDHIINNETEQPFINSNNVRFKARLQYIAGMFIALIYLDTLTLNFNPSKYPTSYARFLTTNGIMQILMQRHAPTEVHLPETVRQMIVACFISLSGALENLGTPSPQMS
ncbi:hypothetical protein [Sideroxydans sp. CL21]|uniref:hypothetical protein n=1 Tax=Sideroxydans sp. CL21 TaxID=2600596 RepID=UPI0024BD219C|nr:hypothetical protein [Sideroxydans sp. CL21]